MYTLLPLLNCHPTMLISLSHSLTPFLIIISSCGSFWSWMSDCDILKNEFNFQHFLHRNIARKKRKNLALLSPPTVTFFSNSSFYIFYVSSMLLLCMYANKKFRVWPRDLFDRYTNTNTNTNTLTIFFEIKKIYVKMFYARPKSDKKFWFRYEFFF